MDATEKADMNRLVEFAHAGAVQAADAFAQLVGHPVTTFGPVVLAGHHDPSFSAHAPASDAASTGIFFEFEGCLDAIIGILFPADASDFLVRRIVGIEDGELETPIVESALMEVGNILASHVASAIADRLSARLLPSIPSLAMSQADAEFEAFIDRVADHAAPRIESRMCDEDGRSIGRLVLVPTS